MSSLSSSNNLNVVVAVPGGAVDGLGAQAHGRDHPDHRVRQDAARLPQVPSGGPDCST